MSLTRLLYKSHLFVAGSALVILGFGNYLAAITKVNHYQQVLLTATPPYLSTSTTLFYTARPHFPTEARERWEITRAKLDFYHVVLSAGRLMISIGLFCTALGLIRVRRQRTLIMAQLAPPTDVGSRYAQSQS